MARSDRSRKATGTLSRTRMEAFSDGVLAIAITLLVLDLAVRPPGTPLEQFLQAWPAYLAYVVSFLTIGAAWIAHNAFTDRLDRADVLLLRLNLLFLMVVAFLPFPTRLVAGLARPRRRNRTGRGRRLRAHAAGHPTHVPPDRRLQQASEAAPVDRRGSRPSRRTSEVPLRARRLCADHLLGILLPVVAVVFYCVLAIVLVVPFRTVGQFLSGNHATDDPDLREPIDARIGYLDPAVLAAGIPDRCCRGEDRGAGRAHRDRVEGFALDGLEVGELSGADRELR